MNAILLVALMVASFGPPAVSPQRPTETEQASAEITVTGERRQEKGVAPTGSRVSRREPIVQFQSVATSTGVAGLLPGSGMDPFAGGTRYVTQVQCRSDNDRLSDASACRLEPIQRAVAAGSFEEARSAIDRLTVSEAASDEERYVAASLLYRVGLATGETADREDAIHMMLSTSSMPQNERFVAYRTLVAIALERNDRTGAARLLEQLVAIAPEDSRSRVNLAALYAEAGRSSEAAALVREAIAIASRRGETVPSEWASFASSATSD